MLRKRILLYKHQWNTRWTFVRKLDIFTCENNMLSSRVKISPMLWLHNKSCPSYQRSIRVEKVWYLIGVYIIKRTLHGHLEIWNFSSHVEKQQHSKRNSVYPCGHVISSIYLTCNRLKRHCEWRVAAVCFTPILLRITVLGVLVSPVWAAPIFN